jgi:protein involved in polysaccharide export with SLBB domain
MHLFKRIQLLFIFLILIAFQTYSQLPADMRNIKASQISDQQLQQIAQQFQSSGMTEADLMQQLQSRGLPEAEITTLVGRIKAMTGVGGAGESVAAESSTGAKRTFKGEMTVFKAPEVKSKVFGAELFSGANPMFVPNLKIATPKSYVIGPEDELQLDIYGNNISNQKLVVSPDGLVNIKYAGPVNVSGLTIEQANNVIKSRLLKYYPALSSGATKIQLTLGSVRSIQVSVIGAVKKPGTVTLPSIATLFNALYASGGPLDNGSFRNIELIRNSKVLVVADLYDFIVKGDQKSNLSLQENDVIKVPFANIQVNLDGGLNRTGIFEMKVDESLQNALEFAGGFKSNAFKGAVSGTRFTDIEKKIIDVKKENYTQFKLQHGDSLYVDSLAEKFENRVSVTGAVFKPGAYSLEQGMDLKTLINKAQGLKDDAFVGRANLVRKSLDLKKEYKSFNLKKILSGTEKFLLQKEDSIHIVSSVELRDIKKVQLIGPVVNPGEFVYEDSLTLQALILQAGGFQENAELTSIEIGRRKSNIDPTIYGVNTSEIILVNTNRELSEIGEDVFLQPYDIVSIKTDPAKVKQLSVKVSGEVKFASNYTLENPNERISSIVRRAGGLLPYADIEGAKLRRKKDGLDTSQLKRLANASTSLKSRTNKDSMKVDESLALRVSDVAIDLKRAIERPGSSADLTLKDGDELIIPKYINTVDVQGEVLKPVSVQFEDGRGLGNYVSAAGGFTKNALRNRAFVVYPNGRSAKTTNFLGMRFYPKVKAGSTVFVPIKPEQKGFDPSKLGVLISALTSLSTIFVLLFK